MNYKIKRVIALALSAMVLLSACSSNTKSDSTDTNLSDSNSNNNESIKDLVLAKLASTEIETFNIFASQGEEVTNNLTNLTDGLLEVNNKGQLVPCIAETWETNDNGKTWTFHLRDGVKWVDVNGNEKADCTAQDFATGLEWILNYHKNGSLNTSMPIEMIQGASEYYEYTKTLSKEDAYKLTAGKGSKFLEMVGITIPDDNTVTYHCVTELPYFDSLAAYACLYPASQSLIDQLGIDGFLAMNNENMWYNGAYLMTSFIQGNEKIFSKNPAYWDTECTLFDTVTIKMVDSNEVAYQLYQSGEIDYVQLGESSAKTIIDNPDHEFHDQIITDLPSKISSQFHWNYSKNNEDGTLDTNWNTAIANEAFRLSWYYGLDLTDFYKRYNPLSPSECETNTYTQKNFVYTSDGTDYTDLVKENLGLKNDNSEGMARIDTEKAASYKKQAMEELSELGVTFPIEADYYIASGNQTALDTATVLKDAISKYLGDDYVTLNILTYVSSSTKEVRDPGLHSFGLNGWGADYGDPQNLLGQELYGYDNAYFSQNWTRINLVEENEATKDLLNSYKEFTSLVEKANSITDNLDERYKAFAEAEAYLIQHGLTTPCYTSSSLCLSKINIHSKPFALFGGCNNKMKNWETSQTPYTSQQMDSLSNSI